MAKQATMDAIESTIDTAAETVDTLERIPRVNLNGTTKQQQIIILSMVAVVSAATGAVAAYYVIKGKVALRRKKARPVAVAPASTI